jgi:hypothetical protein
MVGKACELPRQEQSRQQEQQVQRLWAPIVFGALETSVAGMERRVGEDRGDQVEGGTCGLQPGLCSLSE